MRHGALLFVLVGVGCSSSAPTGSPNPDPGPPSAAECRGDLPERLSISEGGRLTFARKADVAYEGTGGAVVTVDETTVAIRAPYIASAEGEVALTLGCGQTLPIDLRPLAWTSVAEWKETTGAKAREYGAWWIDPEGTGGLVVFGGFHYEPKQFTPANDAWRFDFASSTWTELAGTGLPLLPGGRAAAIPGERAVWFFGGSIPTEDGGVETPPSLYRFDYDQTSITPTKIDELGSALGSYTGSFIYDAKRKRWLSVCGVDATVGAHCRVFAFAGAGGFTEIETSKPGPKGRYGFHYAYDELTDRVIIFGGQNGQQEDAIDGETWALDLAVDPPAWKLLFANGDGPTKRRNGAFALDPLGHRLFLWGGTPDGVDSIENLQALSLDRDAEKWAEIKMPREVIERTSGFGVYDAARERILFGFGNNGPPLRDLWALDTANVNPR